MILADGSIVELDNVASDPRDAFAVRPEDMLRHVDRAVATWHTHPRGSCNLTVEDWDGFRAWPQLKHWIVGLDGQACYEVTERGSILRCA